MALRMKMVEKSTETINSSIGSPFLPLMYTFQLLKNAVYLLIIFFIYQFRYISVLFSKQISIFLTSLKEHSIKLVLLYEHVIKEKESFVIMQVVIYIHVIRILDACQMLRTITDAKYIKSHKIWFLTLRNSFLVLICHNFLRV